MRPCRPRPLLAALSRAWVHVMPVSAVWAWGAMASLATPAFMAALMAWQAECMRAMMAASGRGYILGASYLSVYSRSRSRCSCVVVCN